MSKIYLLLISFLLCFLVSCGGDGSNSCADNEDCGVGFTCDKNEGQCVPETTNGGENHVNSESGEGF